MNEWGYFVVCLFVVVLYYVVLQVVKNAKAVEGIYIFACMRLLLFCFLTRVKLGKVGEKKVVGRK